MRGTSETLSKAELELDLHPLTKTTVAVPARAWVRYAGIATKLDLEVVAWTPRALAVRWKTPAGEADRAWAWVSAVERDELISRRFRVCETSAGVGKWASNAQRGRPNQPTNFAAHRDYRVRQVGGRKRIPMSTPTPSCGFTLMSDAEVLGAYGPNLDMARLFECCEKQVSRTERIGEYNFFVLHYNSNAEVKVIDGEFVVGEDVAEMWSDEKYSDAVHNVNYCMNENYATESLHPWLVQACEASRGWEWHTNPRTEQVPPTVPRVVMAKPPKSIMSGFARMGRLAVALKRPTS